MAVTRGARPTVMRALRDMLETYGVKVADERYLELIAGNWVDQLLHVSYSAYSEVMAGALSGTLGPLPVASDIAAYRQQTLTTEFHDALRTTIAALLGADRPEARRIAGGGVRCSVPGTGLKKRLATGMLGTSRPAVLFCNPYYKCSMAEWGRLLWQWRRWARWDDLDIQVTMDVEIDQEWRRQRSSNSGTVKSFASLVEALLPLHVPAILLEGFNEFRANVLAQGLFRPRVAYTANALHVNMPFKLLCAEWRREGTQLVCHQHGSGYGLDRENVLEDYETSVADRYYSWGWRRAGRPVSPLSPAYPKLVRRPRRSIMLVCCSFPTVFYRLNYHPMPGTLDPVGQNTDELLVNLPGTQPLMIRLQPGNNGLRFRDAMLSLAPHAQFDDLSVPIFTRFEQHALVLHNYFGTGVLEGLAFNVPTLALYHEASYAYRPDAQPLIDDLERVGILQRSGAAAGAFVAEVIENLDAWWQSDEVQGARQRFVAEHANFSSDWKIQWENELLQLAG